METALISGFACLPSFDECNKAFAASSINAFSWQRPFSTDTQGVVLKTWFHNYLYIQKTSTRSLFL